MILAMLFVLQVPDGGKQALPLPGFTAIPRCPRDIDRDDIVVCGSVDQEKYRLRPPLPRGDAKGSGPPQAQVRLGGGTLGLTTQSGNVGGVSTNRVMLGWKTKF